MTPLTDQIREARRLISEALQVNDAAMRILTSHRAELARIDRQLREQDEELTPVRPPSRDDMRAALDGAQRFSERPRAPGRPIPPPIPRKDTPSK